MTTISPVIKTLSNLVRIPSVNPNYEGGTGEEMIAEWIHHFFDSHQIQVIQQPVLPGRFNVIAKLPGQTPHKRLILEAHVDTVSTKGMEVPPYEPNIRQGHLHGRGSCDTKGGLSAMMHAMVEIKQSGRTPDAEVWFVATVDEEYSYRGVAKYCEQYPQGDAAIIAEPTQLRAVIASKGLLRCKIVTQGTAAHSAKPELGQNAILTMLPVIKALQEDHDQLQELKHPFLGAATCNVGTIKGGTQINFVPDQCEIEIDRRLLPHETPEEIMRHYQRILDVIMEKDPRVKATLLPPLLTDLPLETRPETKAVRIMQDVLQSHGQSHEPMGVPFCSDASKFGALGIPSIILGPGCIDQAHASVEYVECSQVEKAVGIYRDFALCF